MKAVRIHAPNQMQLDDIAIPQPGAGEVRVRLEYAGLNFIDIYQRSGVYPLPLPATLGMEGAGTVDALGEGVTILELGQRVAYTMTRGSYAAYAIVSAKNLVTLPETISTKLAAATMLQGMTAHYLAFSTYRHEAGDTALIHAAAGGVGQLLVQMAKRAGAVVVATVGSAEKAQIVKNLGADVVIDYRREDFVIESKKYFPKGFDVIYDSVGKDTFMRGLDLLKPRGMMVLYGGSSGQVEPLDLQILNAKGSLFVTRPSLGHYISDREELEWRAAEVFDWLATGQLRLEIDKIFALEDAASAHAYIESRQTKGKVLLKI
ncbi:MAG: quinone oxidoreductase family protein [Deinococcales bacterium]